jgi:ABC-type uncharacterized transport system ATPase component
MTNYYHPRRLSHLDAAQRDVVQNVMHFELHLAQRDGVYDDVGEKLVDGERYTLLVLAERDLPRSRAVTLLDKRTALVDPRFSAGQIEATWAQMRLAAA